MRNNHFPRFIPANSEKHENGSCVWYTSLNAYNQFIAIGYFGQRSKPDFYFRFATEKQRSDYIEAWLRTKQAANEYREQRKSERKQFEHGFQNGDILFGSWGYEQTNVEFFQVVRVPSKKSITVQKLLTSTIENEYMSGSAYPRKDEFTSSSKPETHKVSPGGTHNPEGLITIEHATLSKWDGKPKHFSSYH